MKKTNFNRLDDIDFESSVGSRKGDYGRRRWSDSILAGLIVTLLTGKLI